MTTMRTKATTTTTHVVTMVDDILIRALAGAVILAAMLGPLGSFVVWRRMAYFGDTIAHASLLGVALSLLVGGALPMTVAIFLVAAGVAILLTRYTHDGRLQADTMLGILAHGTLALGLVLVALNHEVRVDVNAYLFGDVLTMDWADVTLLMVLLLAVVGTLAWRWRGLLMATIHPAIARIEGINIRKEQLVLTLLMAAVIAVAVKIVGALLITAMLIIPAAAARFVANSPLIMAVIASGIGMLSAGIGLAAAFALDLPAGAMMVVAAVAVFAATSLLRK